MACEGVRPGSATRDNRRVFPDAGASAGDGPDCALRCASGKPPDAKRPFRRDHASVRVGSAAMPAPFCYAPQTASSRDGALRSPSLPLLSLAPSFAGSFRAANRSFLMRSPHRCRKMETAPGARFPLCTAAKRDELWQQWGGCRRGCGTALRNGLESSRNNWREQFCPIAV